MLSLKLLHIILRVSPDVADGDAALFRPMMHLLHELLPALLRERREGEAYHLSVVDGVIPRSLCWIAFSICAIEFLSNGWTTSSLGSGTFTDASWFRGTGVP